MCVIHQMCLRLRRMRLRLLSHQLRKIYRFSSSYSSCSHMFLYTLVPHAAPLAEHQVSMTPRITGLDSWCLVYIVCTLSSQYNLKVKRGCRWKINVLMHSRCQISMYHCDFRRCVDPPEPVPPDYTQTLTNGRVSRAPGLDE